MAFLQSQFTKFHNNIRLGDIEDNQVLREKRDLLFDIVKKWCKENGKPVPEKFDQGSYSMGTGIIPINNEDYDIDVGLIFNINVADYCPVEVKKWVYTALNANNFRDVSMKYPCVRAQYHKNGEVAFHVDFAIYGNKYGFLGYWDGYQLAKGRLNSGEDYRIWEDSEPKELKKLINSLFSDKEERHQFKRCIRALKRWKDENFTSTGNARPTGISFTAMAYDFFSPEVEKWNGEKDIDDLTALKNLVAQIINNNYGLNITLPVKPGNELLEQMRQSQTNEENYIKKIDKLYDALDNASEETDPHEAAKILRKVFGKDFPIPSKIQTGIRTSGPAIALSTESA